MIYCGVDGGGTKTKVVVASDERIIGTFQTGPSALDTVSMSEAQKHIEEALQEIIGDTYQIDRMFIGLGGVPSREAGKEFAEHMMSSTYIKDTAVIECDNDIINAFNASCSGRNNITLIIGTGSVGYGKDDSGKSHRASGVHYLEGDRGSGYYLGLQALQLVSKVFDGRMDSTPLLSHLLSHFEIKTFEDIVQLFSRLSDDRTVVASVAKTVVEFAQNGDELALDLLDNAASEIADIIRAVDQKIFMTNREIGIVGSLGNSEPYRSMIIEKIHQYDSYFIIHESELDPVMGALIESKRV